MKRWILLLMLVVFMMPSLSACSKDTRRDRNLQLELVCSQSVYDSNEPIDCTAILSYIGEEDSFDFYTGDPAMMFAIGGGQYFNGQSDLLQLDVFNHFTIEKDHPIEFPFVKYMGFHLGRDQDAVDFWNEFLAKDEFLLEPGDYEIFAAVWYVLTPGDKSSIITVSKTITVE